MNAPLLLNQFKKSFSEFWAARNVRERAMLSVAVVAMVLASTYVLLVDPAWSGRIRLDKNLLELRQQVAQMQALSKVAMALAKAPAKPLPEQPGAGNSAAQALTMTQANIETALARNGLKPKNVMVNGSMVKVQFAAASFSGILNWLDEMQKSAQLAVTNAHIVALVQPDSVDATLTLRQQGHE